MAKRTCPELFVGVTSWNSECFLPICLESLRNTTENISLDLVVLDNYSSDRSREIAATRGARVITRRCNQGDALNILATLSKARYTLLIHSDVVFLNRNWFRLVSTLFDLGTALVSPNDIGCGPMSRPFGQGKPESSFMFFQTEAMRSLREISIRRRRFWPIVTRRVNFYGNHVTHALPETLLAKKLNWKMMNVHASDRTQDPIYVPEFKPAVWSDELAYLRYGLGNFYSIEGQITHYHNWYDRVPKNVDPASTEGTSNSGGFPLAYVSAYTKAFVRDYMCGEVHLPSNVSEAREPRLL